MVTLQPTQFREMNAIVSEGVRVLDLAASADHLCLSFGFDNPNLCDAPLELDELSYEFVDDLHQLEPFGQGNPEPIFFVKNVKISSTQTIGSERKHLKL